MILVTLGAPFHDLWRREDLDRTTSKSLDRAIPKNWKLIVPKSADEEEAGWTLVRAGVVFGVKITRNVTANARKLRIIQALGAR